MNPSEPTEASQKMRALWITVILEAVMIVAVGVYNIYEVRRNSELVQQKIQGVADFSARQAAHLEDFSARQGAKLDRMTTAIESYVGRKFSADESNPTNSAVAGQRVEKAIEFLESWKNKGGKTQSEGATNSTSSATGDRH